MHCLLRFQCPSRRLVDKPQLAEPLEIQALIGQGLGTGPDVQRQRYGLLSCQPFAYVTSVLMIGRRQVAVTCRNPMLTQ